MGNWLFEEPPSAVAYEIHVGTTFPRDEKEGIYPLALHHWLTVNPGVLPPHLVNIHMLPPTCEFQGVPKLRCQRNSGARSETRGASSARHYSCG